jgi:hypothetical protein
VRKTYIDRINTSVEEIFSPKPNAVTFQHIFIQTEGYDIFSNTNKSSDAPEPEELNWDREDQ